MALIAEWAAKWAISGDALADLRHSLTNRPCGDEEPATGPEGDVQSAIRLEAIKMKCIMLRNNSGGFENLEGRFIRFGLGNDSNKLNKVYKSPDLVGLRWDGRGIFVECKKPGWRWSGSEREVGQLNFLTHMSSFGGLCGFAQSVDDFRQIVNRD